MAETIRHRGPDATGSWTDPDGRVALGHRRLSVIDPSPAGHQPMVSGTGRYVVAYNGEVYNFRALRRDLEGRGAAFRGHSDTEVLLAAVERWGFQDALPRLNGMFAFALWDRQERRLLLARDRTGEKPLYYGWIGRTFVFASELRAFRAHPTFDPRVDRGSVALYLRHNCIPAPRSIYEGVSKLTPGTVLTVRGDARSHEDVDLSPYWSPHAVVESGTSARAQPAPDDVVGEAEARIREAVSLRLEADVPMGAFLSGGIDSSLVVALMQAQSKMSVRTFTIGFDDPAYDESHDAARVARHLGTDHVDLRVSADEAMAVIPRLGTIYDEPFGDTSQIPVVLVSELARRDVTVVLSGDGGDELFGGYNRYAWQSSLRRWFGWLPRPLRTGLGTALAAVPPTVWDAAGGSRLLPRRLRVRQPATKVQKVAGALRADDADDLYLWLASHWKQPGDLVLGADEPSSLLAGLSARPPTTDPVEQMMYLDLATYLPDDVLVKVDRAAMSVGLETRCPLLDHTLVEWAWQLPMSVKVRHGRGKWLMRQVLYRHVPQEIVDRPKSGFGPPIGAWLRGPLRAWGDDLLADARLREQGFLDSAVVRTVWDDHVLGKQDAGYELWDVLMFQSWLEAAGPV